MTNTKDENKDFAKEQLLDFVGYALTSTKGLYREPQSYGPMRMVDMLEKALTLLKEQGLHDQSLDHIMGVLRENRWKVTADPEAYALALDEAIHRLVTVTLKA